MKKALKSVTLTLFAIAIFIIACGTQSPVLSQGLHPGTSYRIHVDATDLTGFAVEMKIGGERESAM